MTGQLVHLGIVQGMALDAARGPGRGPAVVGGARHRPDAPSTGAGRSDRGSPWPWVTLLAALIGLDLLDRRATGHGRDRDRGVVRARSGWCSGSYPGDGVEPRADGSGASATGCWRPAGRWPSGRAQLLPGRSFIVASQRASRDLRLLRRRDRSGPRGRSCCWSRTSSAGTPSSTSRPTPTTTTCPRSPATSACSHWSRFVVLLVRSVGRRSDPRARDWRPVGRPGRARAASVLGRLHAARPRLRADPLLQPGTPATAATSGSSTWVSPSCSASGWSCSWPANGGRGWPGGTGGPVRSSPRCWPPAAALATALVALAFPATVLVAFGASPIQAFGAASLDGRPGGHRARGTAGGGGLARGGRRPPGAGCSPWWWPLTWGCSRSPVRPACSPRAPSPSPPGPSRRRWWARAVGSPSSGAPSINALSHISLTDINGLTSLDSVQGYGSIVSGNYENATGTHQVASMDPCALAQGVFVQLRLSTLLVVPYELIEQLAPGAQPSPPAQCRAPRPGTATSRTWYLGQDLELATVQLDGGTGATAPPAVGVLRRLRGRRRGRPSGSRGAAPDGRSASPLHSPPSASSCAARPVPSLTPRR